MSRRLPALLALVAPGCDVWISADDYKQYQIEHCELVFSELDADGDGFLPLDVAAPDACPLSLDELLASSPLLPGDCDDLSPDSFPGAADPCDDGVDQDCDGADPATETWYDDLDGDGYGDPDAGEPVCGTPDAGVQDASDCDDTDGTVNPDGVEEVCGDAVDGDCDGSTDCAVAGDEDLSRSGWAELGNKITVTASLDEATFAAGEDLNGDGLRDAALSTSNGLLALTWTGDGVDAESISTGTSSPSRGALAMLPDPIHSGGIALAWGDPGSGAEGDGVVWVRSAEGDKVSLSAASDEVKLGIYVGDGGDSLFVAVHRTETLAQWSASIIDDNAVPDTSATLASVETDRLIIGNGTPSTLVGFHAAPRPDGDDLVVSWTPGTTDPDRVVWYQAPITSEGEPTLTLTHGSRTGDFGATSEVLDLDGTGADDLVIGTANSARVYVFTDPRAGSEAESDDADYRPDGIGNFGAALANVGDFNGDGASDLVIGASEEDQVVLLLGGVTPVETAYSEPYAELSGAAGGDLGAAIAGDDMDGDGFDDLLLTEPGSDAIYLIWGGPPR